MVRDNLTMSFPVPAELADGTWVFRIEHLALHLALPQIPKGAQFYVRCVDVEIRNGGGMVPSEDSFVHFPGAYVVNGPGLVYDFMYVLERNCVECMDIDKLFLVSVLKGIITLIGITVRAIIPRMARRLQHGFRK